MFSPPWYRGLNTKHFTFWCAPSAEPGVGNGWANLTVVIVAMMAHGNGRALRIGAYSTNHGQRISGVTKVKDNNLINKPEIEKRRDRIIGFLDLMDAIPAETSQGLERDRLHRARLLSELESLGLSLNVLAGICQVKNSLRRNLKNAQSETKEIRP